MLTPSVKDENRKEELKRKQEHPEDFGPSRPVDMGSVRKAREAEKRR